MYVAHHSGLRCTSNTTFEDAPPPRRPSAGTMSSTGSSLSMPRTQTTSSTGSGGAFPGTPPQFRAAAQQVQARRASNVMPLDRAQRVHPSGGQVQGGAYREGSMRPSRGTTMGTLQSAEPAIRPSAGNASKKEDEDAELAERMMDW